MNSAVGSVELLIVFGLVAIVGLAVAVWWLLMLIEALKIPAGQWEAAGQNQILYVVAMFLVGVLGTLLYVFIARPQLRAKGAVQ